MGWLEDKAAALAAAESEKECPECGATGNSPCVTASGKVAKKDHKERVH